MKIILIILFLILKCVNVYATNYFTDGFESGDFTGWDGGASESGTGNTVTVIEGAARSGTYGVQIHADGQASGDDNHVSHAISNQGEIYWRFYIKFSSDFTMTEDDVIKITDSWDDSWGLCPVVVILGSYGGNDTFYLWMNFSDDGDNWISLPGWTYDGWACGSIIDNAWHCIEIHFKQGTGSDGVIEMFVDGIDRAGGSDDYDIDSQNFAIFYLGANDLDSGTSGDIFYDDVTIEDTYTGITSIKTINGLAKASVKTIDGLAVGSVKKIDGAAAK